MWHFGACFSRRGGVGVTIGLDDLRGLPTLMTLHWSPEGLHIISVAHEAWGFVILQLSIVSFICVYFRAYFPLLS